MSRDPLTRTETIDDQTARPTQRPEPAPPDLTLTKVLAGAGAAATSARPDPSSAPPAP